MGLRFAPARPEWITGIYAPEEMIPGVEMEGAPFLIDLLNEYQALTF